MTGAVIAVTGLLREARALASPHVRTVVSGGDGEALLQRLQAALEAAPAAGVISVGLGGALAPELQVGDWVVANGIAGAGGWSTDADWRVVLVDALAETTLAGGKARLGWIAGARSMLVGAAEKRALYAETGALAVDMESHVAAAFAAEHGLPFAALRVISDTADRDLPKAVLAGMRPDGGMDLAGVLGSLARDPRQLPALIRTGRDAGVAFRRLALLGGDHLLCGPGIGCPYLG